ncbi:hypothetical protein GCT13_35465 [Paraburkholderia sp. CNPSo 3157]|uniref:Uncharacterized protein n=1 Tax=Paraburkholderia franconis TaxID=2654983 RepID=A0A7X1NHB7_9BURK|nr:hypothetical protein [Paraburkholderia franconis]MPW22008.1 hypothetical protein [Paraburkholderia franconis]
MIDFYCFALQTLICLAPRSGPLVMIKVTKQKNAAPHGAARPKSEHIHQPYCGDDWLIVISRLLNAQSYRRISNFCDGGYQYLASIKSGRDIQPIDAPYLRIRHSVLSIIGPANAC